jgi:aminopeptidase N
MVTKSKYIPSCGKCGQILTRSRRVISEAKRRFDLYTSGTDRTAVHQNLRTVIFSIAIREGGKSEYAALKKEWQTTSSVDGKEISLRALGRIQDLDLLQDYLSFLFNDVATQDMHTGASALSANAKTRSGLWKYIQDNFDPIKDKLGKNMVVLDRFIKLSLNKFNDRATEKEIAHFFEGRDNRGYDRTLNVVRDTILGRAAYRERDGEVIFEWLSAHGYA